MDIVPYKEEYGPVQFPEGFEQTIRGLSIQEQMDHFRTVSSATFYTNADDWRELSPHREYTRLEDTYGLSKLIVKDGLIVGAMMWHYSWKVLPCMIGRSVATCCHNDEPDHPGVSWIEYTCLKCVPPDFDK